MLEFLRRSATSVFAWIVLGVIALVFGLSFGLPGESLSFGAEPLVRVEGENIGDDDYRYQFSLMSKLIPFPEDPELQELMGVREEILDAAVERELLSERAQDMGLEATKWDAESLVLDGHLILLGDTIDWMTLFGLDRFEYDSFKNFLRVLQVSEPRYLEYQRDEILARTLRDLVTASTVVPEEAIRAEYERDANQLSLRYVRFSPTSYAELVDPTREEIERYVQANRDRLLEEFRSQAMRFTKLPKQVRLRLIEIAGTDDNAHKAARGALARIRGGDTFAAVAREVSRHDTARGGGDYGWVTVEGTGSGLDPAIDRVAADLPIDRLSDIVQGENSLFLVRIDGQREGDVPEAEALAELAAEKIETERGKALARQAAEEALLAVKSGKSLEKMFEAPRALGSDGGTPIEELGGTGPEQADRPAVRVTGLFGKDRPIPGIGTIPELAKAAWESDDKAGIIDRVFEGADGFIIAGVERKELATDEGLAEQRQEIHRRLADSKAASIMSKWAVRACLEAKAAGNIIPAEDKIGRLMIYDSKLGVDEQGKRVMRPYSVCDRVGPRGGLFRPAMATQRVGAPDR